MRWSSGRPPKELISQLTLVPHERLLATARSARGEWYVGTNLAIHLPIGADGGYRRVPWEEVERADWQRESGRLAVVEVAAWGEPERVTVVHVDEAGRLLELLRERVTKSVVCTLYAPVRRRAGLTVVGRRSPSGNGPITWSYLLSAGLDPADPAVATVADQTLEQVQREVEGL